MKKYLIVFVKNVFLQIVSLIFIVGLIAFAAITWPSGTPGGEVPGGLFMNYFNSMLVNPNDPNDGTVKKAVKVSKLFPTDNDDIASKIYVNNQVAAAGGGYVKGAYYGGCTMQAGVDFKITTAAGTSNHTLARPMLSCGNVGEYANPNLICDTGFYPFITSITQMNGGTSSDGWGVLDKDVYWSSVVCIKS